MQRVTIFIGVAVLGAANLTAAAGAGGCVSSNESCFDPHGSPSCNDDQCCAIVCALDPWCCNVEWDQPCATLAIELCSDCGFATAGDCGEANGNPACNNPDCCQTICNLMPECCETAWDAACAQLANDLVDLLGACEPVWIPGPAPPGLPIGVATLDPAHACSDCLVVSNIGASGDDGVEFMHDELGPPFAGYCAASVDFEPLPAATFGTALIGQAGLDIGTAQLSLETRATFGLFLGQPAAVITTNAPNLGYTNFNFRVLLGGETVAALDNIPWPDGLVAGAEAMPSGFDLFGSADGIGFGWVWLQPVVITMNTEVGPIVLGDTLIVETAAPPPPDTRLGRIQARAALVPGPLTITAVELDPVTCVGDLDGDGLIGASDLAVLLAAWGPNPFHPADFNFDGFVDSADLATLLAAWGACPE